MKQPGEKEPSQSAKDEATKIANRHVRTTEYGFPSLIEAIATALAAKDAEIAKWQAESLRFAEKVGVVEQERDTLRAERNDWKACADAYKQSRDEATEREKALRAEVEMLKRAERQALADRCETCGAKVYYGPPDCPLCGAPNCCQQCCKIDSLRTQLNEALEALRPFANSVGNEIRMTHNNVERYFYNFIQTGHCRQAAAIIAKHKGGV